VVFAHADHPIAKTIDFAVGVTQIGFGCDCLRLCARVYTVQALVGEI
jgi:hypothetical protein